MPEIMSVLKPELDFVLDSVFSVEGMWKAQKYHKQKYT
jgi:hypothetical protein